VIFHAGPSPMTVIFPTAPNAPPIHQVAS
jgi:hypothetical protein